MQQHLVRLTRASAASRHAIQLSWPVAAAKQAQQLAAAAAAQRRVDRWEVTGHSTPNLTDIGGASVRLRRLVVGDGSSSSSTAGEAALLPDGGFLFCMRPAQTADHEYRWLPAIAGVPGERGPDDHGNFRPGLAECMVFARPLVQSPPTTVEQAVPSSTAVHRDLVTTVHEQALAQLFPVGQLVEVVRFSSYLCIELPVKLV